MTPFHYCYMAGWMLACGLATILMIRHRQKLELFQLRYWRFLLQTWKVLSFIVAASGLIIIAPYTGDPTWDYVDAAFMAVLTFSTAPWAVGVVYRSLRRQVPWSHTYIAICVWLFSASWSYDLYLVIRDGGYPITWFTNIFASSVLYLSAGLLWNLTWMKNRGVVFGFMESNWLDQTADSGFRKILWFALPFMILATVAIVSFL